MERREGPSQHRLHNTWRRKTLQQNKKAQKYSHQIKSVFKFEIVFWKEEAAAGGGRGEWNAVNPKTEEISGKKKLSIQSNVSLFGECSRSTRLNL